MLIFLLQGITQGYVALHKAVSAKGICFSEYIQNIVDM